MLSDLDIEGCLSDGLDGEKLVIKPYPDPVCFQPASIDLRLSDEFLIPRYHSYEDSNARLCVHVGMHVDQNKGLFNRFYGVKSLKISPGEFVLGSTVEYFEIPSYLCARVEGKSTIGRLGLLVHCTAGFIDPGFCGHITLELRNVGDFDLVLYPGISITQIAFHKLSSPCVKKYGCTGLNSHYNNSIGTVEPVT